MASAKRRLIVVPGSLIATGAPRRRRREFRRAQMRQMGRRYRKRHLVTSRRMPEMERRKRLKVKGKHQFIIRIKLERIAG